MHSHIHTQTPQVPKCWHAHRRKTSAANKPRVHSHTHPANGPATIIVERRRLFTIDEQKKTRFDLPNFRSQNSRFKRGRSRPKLPKFGVPFAALYFDALFIALAAALERKKSRFFFSSSRSVFSGLGQQKSHARENFTTSVRIEAQTPVHDDPHTVTDGEDCRNDEESQIKWRRRLLTRSRTHGPRGGSAADVTGWRGAGEGGPLPLDNFFGKGDWKLVQKDQLAERFEICVT